MIVVNNYMVRVYFVDPDLMLLAVLRLRDEYGAGFLEVLGYLFLGNALECFCIYSAISLAGFEHILIIFPVKPTYMYLMIVDSTFSAK